MKKILLLLALFFGFLGHSQDWQLKGTKYPNATNEGDTVSLQSRLPMLDENGLLNYYLPVADLLALNPAPVLEWGNITGTLSNQTDLQGALNDKADQSDLTAHTSNGNIHFTQSAISITESQISDLKDYLRGDINDTNGANKLTLGSLEVTGQTILQNGLNMRSVPTGTSDNILTLNQSTGDVEQRVFSLGDIDIANAAGVSQFPVGLGEQLRFEGSGDTSISFDGITNTINITSVPGSGTGGAVTSFNGRTGGVVSEAGDYSTAMVNELTNLYFTEPRVRATPLTGLTISNTPISSTNTFLQALGRLQGQINNREVSFSKNTAFNKNFGTSSGTVLQGNWRPSWGDITGTNPSYTKSESDSRYLSSISSNANVNASIQINDGYSFSVGSTNGTSFAKSGGNTLLNVRDGNFIIRDGTTNRFSFGRTTGDFTASGKIYAGAGNISMFSSTNTALLELNGFFTNWIRDASGNGFGFVNSSNQELAKISSTGDFSITGTASVGQLSVTGTTKSAGRLYGGSSNPSNTTRLNYDGHLYVSNLTSIGDVVANSDKRLKKNIKRIDNALAIVQLLGGYEYDRKDVDLHQAGVIAQEVEEVFPTAVSEDEKGIKSVAYNQLIALLIEAIKEQQIEIEQLKTMINEK